MRLSELSERREHLLVRGRLERDDTFVARRCGSTTNIRRWPEAAQPDHGDVEAETLDAEGRVLRTEKPLVESEAVCAPEPSWRLRVYLPLDEEATHVRVRRGDRVLWSMPIGEAPDVAVELTALPTRGESDRARDEKQRTRGEKGRERGEKERARPGDSGDGAFPGGEPAVLALERSRAVDGGSPYVKVVYRWGEGRFRTVFAGQTRGKITIPADRLPGGEHCEFFVSYSNGVRSAVARTEPFELQPIGPVITMVQPAARMRVPRGTPIELECLVQHPESPSLPLRNSERTRWFVDGEPVATGTIGSLEALEEGEHVVTVTSAPDDGDETRAERTLTVLPAREQTVDEWPDHDPFAG